MTAAANRLFVKICGITSPEDAEIAREAGADAIGINFWSESKRFVRSFERAREIVLAAGSMLTVGVFVNAPLDEVRKALDIVRLAQLHGDETPDFAAPLGDRIVRAIRVRDSRSLGELEQFESPFYIVDAPADGYGGGGMTFDWSLVRDACRRKQIVLAGGLSPTNVAYAVRMVRPYGVDVATGVESTPGVKNAYKVRRFIEEARAA